jgi:hypothetical protein
LKKKNDKKNRLSLLKLKQLELNPDLSFEQSQQSASRTEHFIKSIGNIRPVIVAETSEPEIFKLLHGFETINVLQKLKIPEVFSVVLDVATTEDGDLNLNLVSLYLSSLPDENSCAISQGVLISKLISEDGLTVTELANKLKVSKAWVSKRLSMSNNLADEVKSMVRDKQIVPRTAEEVAKLPKDVQKKFAMNILKGYDDRSSKPLSKDTVSTLVKLYNEDNTSDQLKNKIINSPKNVNIIETKKINKLKENQPGNNIKSTILNITKENKKAIKILQNIDNEKVINLKDELAELNNTIVEMERILACIISLL